MQQQIQLKDNEIRIKYCYKDREQKTYVIKSEIQNINLAFKSHFRYLKDKFSPQYNQNCLITDQKKIGKHLKLLSDIIKESQKEIEIYISDREILQDEILVTVWLDKEKIIFSEIVQKSNNIIDTLKNISKNQLNYLSEFGMINDDDTFLRYFQNVDQCKLLAVKNNQFQSESGSIFSESSAILKEQQQDESDSIFVTVYEDGICIGKKNIQKTSSILETVENEFKKTNYFVLWSDKEIKDIQDTFITYLQKGQEEIQLMILLKGKYYSQMIQMLNAITSQYQENLQQIGELNQINNWQTENELFRDHYELRIMSKLLNSCILDQVCFKEQELRQKQIQDISVIKISQIDTVQSKEFQITINQERILQQEKQFLEMNKETLPIYQDQPQKLDQYPSLILPKGNNDSSCIPQSYNCYKCQSKVFTDIEQLHCLHSYHKRCLIELIETAINSNFNQNNFTPVSCYCNQNIKSNIIQRLDKENKNLAVKHYISQLMTLIKNIPLTKYRIKKCNNHYCEFFWILTQSQIYTERFEYCEFCNELQAVN